MNRMKLPIDFRTFVVFWMLSLTCLPLYAPGGPVGDSRSPTEERASWAHREGDPPRAEALNSSACASLQAIDRQTPIHEEF